MELRSASEWAEQQRMREAEEKREKRKNAADYKKRRSMELLAGYDQNLHRWR